MSASRPDDATGQDFRKVLAGLRRSAAKRARLHPAKVCPKVEWVVKAMPASNAAQRVATATIEDFDLLVVEMRDSFLASQPLDAPKITWSFQCGYGKDEVAGTAVPTLEEGQARAEVALRVHLGLEMDG